MKNNQKLIAGLLSGVLLSTTLMMPVASAQSNRDITFTPTEELQLIPTEGLSKEVLIEIIESEKENFIDPSYGDYLIKKFKYDSSDEIQTYGKLTLTAKAGAKALQAAMNKIGKKSWNASVAAIEKTTGTKLVVLHWQSMSKLIHVLSNSHDTIGNAITDFLVQNGFNRTFAKIITNAFVAVFL